MKLVYDKKDKSVILVNDEGHIVSRPDHGRKVYCTSLLTVYEFAELLLDKKMHIVGRNGLTLLMDDKEMEVEKRGFREDPTRMSPRDELRAEVLRVVSDMFVTTSDPDMLMKDKYEILTELDMPKLMDVCMEG